jgi:hypothetical protein
MDMPGLVMLFAFALSLGFSGLVAVALISYIRRTWQTIRSESDHSIDHQILDGIDQIQTRLDLLAERMDGMERALLPGPSRQELSEGQGEANPQQANPSLLP